MPLSSIFNKIRYKISNNSIERNFILLLIYFIVIFILGFFAIKKEELLRNQMHYLNNIHQEIEKIISVEIESSKYAINNIAKLIKSSNGDVSSINNIIFDKNNNDELIHLYKNRKIFWIDNKDNIVADSQNGILNNKINIKDYHYLKSNKIIDNDITISENIKDFHDQQPVITVSKGIFKNNKYIGSIAINITTKSLQEKIDSIIICRQIKMALIDSNNNIILKSGNFEDKELIELINDHQDSATISEKGLFSNTSKVSDLKNIDNYPIKTLLSYHLIPTIIPDFTQYLNIAENNFYRMHLFLIFVFTVMAIIYIRIFIIKPVIKLARVANDISKRKNVAIPYYSNIEIRILASGLNGLKNILETESNLRKEISYEQRKFELLRKERNEMIDSICHDLKNHIFAISGLSDLINKEIKQNKGNINEAEITRIINLIYSQISLLQNFVVEIQVRDNIDSNKKIASTNINKLEYCNINEMLRQICDSFTIRMIQDEIAIKFYLGNNLPLILCNQNHFKQIFTNIISNSIKYSNSQSTITIITKFDNISRELEIAIIDQGIGMTQEELAKMLEGKGSEIAKSGLRKSYKSEGIGIKNIQKLLDINFGKLKVESQKNIGTKFMVIFSNLYDDSQEINLAKKHKKLSFDYGIENQEQLLNVTNQNIEKENEEEITQEKNDHKTEKINHINNNLNIDNDSKHRDKNSIKYKIANIDDSQINLIVNRKKIEKIIENSKVEIFQTAISGIEAIKNNKNYDIILMDIDMPEVNGYIATFKIREFNRRTPIIAYSSRSFEEVKNFIHNSIFNDYINKEDDNEILSSKLKFWLDYNNNKINIIKADISNNIDKTKELLVKSKILIVDDQPTNLMIISKIFSNHNCTVLQAMNNQELLEIYELNNNSTHPIDLIISDINLGKENSYDAISKIKANDRKIRAICFTGDNDCNNISRYLISGFDDFFIKSHSFQLLLEIAVSQLIEKERDAYIK